MFLEVGPADGGPAEAMWDKCLFDEVTPSLEAWNDLDAMGIEFVIWEAFSIKKNASRSRGPEA